MQIRSLVKATTHKCYLLKSFDTETKRTKLIEVKQQQTLIRSLKGNFYEMTTGNLNLLITKAKHDEMIVKNS